MPHFDQYRALLAQPDWHRTSAQLPSAVAQWLRHNGSLTEKMQQCWQDFRVNLVQQGWQAVDSTSLFAKTPSHHTACTWLREVLIESEGQPRIFAQTLIPQATVEKVAQAVLTLGEQPIGLWLFPQQPQRLSLDWRHDRHTECYARRSTLSLKGYPLEIRELFLPTFPFEAVPRKA
ncbi:chorismate lyase [Muribacter muris]|uniref:Chorismate lyase n=1 Tax=Muribacter muris TaxID=67855 RepID=A0A4Y9K8P6_9PAST|nr:chorismate lyase [Muribacter muris]MBF0784039.1 chorismate lyase [Muribacter muris]MBF0827534.1 chorismate lyase [Muribacter muris]TFV13097.1 chorismate lyase [Muribacter muris]